MTQNKPSNIILLQKFSQKGDFENPQVQNCCLSTESVPDWCGFSNSAVPWEPKNHTNRGIPEYGFVSETLHFFGITTNLQEAVKKVFLVCGIFNKKVFNNV